MPDAEQHFVPQSIRGDRNGSESIKRVRAWQLREAMVAQGMAKVKMAALMNTSRSQAGRILDPDDVKIQLETLYRRRMSWGVRCGWSWFEVRYPLDVSVSMLGTE